MQWYVAVALCFCAANFVTSLALVGLSSYHLYDDDRYVPVKESQDWFELIMGLIPFSIYVMVVSLFSLWGVIQTNRKWTASVIGLNAACVGGSILFVIFFSRLANAPPITEEDLLTNTKDAIGKLVEARDDVASWIPPWLDHIQKQSSSCCGIRTFKDWEEFWPQTVSLIPESCCITPSNDTTVCPKDLARIPYPGTPAKFIKVDHGCAEEINEQVKRHIVETYKFVGILTVFVIVGEIAYCLVYFVRYYWSGTLKGGGNQKINMMSAGDMGYGDDSSDGLIKLNVAQIGSSNEAMSGEIRIDPDTGNPVVCFNIVSYDNNLPKSQSGSSSITSALLPPVSTKPLPNLNNYSQMNSGNGYDLTDSGVNTIADPVSTSANNKPQRRAVFLVQDSVDFAAMEVDDITSGLGSNDSFDNFGDLPSQDVTRNRTLPPTKDKAIGVTRKKRF